MRVHKRKKKALSTEEEIELDAAKELDGFAYNRNLLNEMKLGKGKAYKQLKEILDSQPQKLTRYKKHAETERQLGFLRQQMMWAQTADSKIKHVNSGVVRSTTYTDPIGTGTIPAPMFASRFPPLH
eukprot:TRINITY_DN67813_c6_g4_i1.p1 TRINITY_DN67813_c6_g4~~TRINITY_DN67813_c6_g4_i1.p1  ORF type:complete len:126 (+),score=16.46 TRINITY_DN67813_c6_g4_i1:33-410(+)